MRARASMFNKVTQPHLSSPKVAQARCKYRTTALGRQYELDTIGKQLIVAIIPEFMAPPLREMPFAETP